MLWRVAFTLSLVLALLAASAHAALPKKRPYKMIWGPATLANGNSAFPFYRSLGVDVLQIQLVWRNAAPTQPANALDPADPAYRWPAEVTRAVERAAEADMSVMLMLRATPDWANGGRGPARVPNDDGTYADFAVAAARRYPSVRHWMIWGEPQRGDQFDPMPPNDPAGPRRYAELLDRAYGALKAENPDNLIIGGNTWSGGVVMPEDFVRWMRLPNGLPPRLDFFGHNPFSYEFPDLPRNPYFPGFRDISDSDTLADEVAAAYTPRDVAPKLWLSEFTVSSQPSNVFNFHVTEEKQADWVRAAFKLAAQEKRIQGLGWFRLLDTTNLASGLVGLSGLPKPAYFAYRSAFCRNCDGRRARRRSR